MQDIDVHSEFTNRVVTLLVISGFFNLLGASRVCVDFRDSTDEFRIIPATIPKKPTLLCVRSMATLTIDAAILVLNQPHCKLTNHVLGNCG